LRQATIMNKFLLSNALLLAVSAGVAYAAVPPAAEARTFDAAQLPNEPPPPPIPPKVPRGIPTDPDAPLALPPIMGGQACAATTDLLNLRTGPGMEYRIITALAPGSIVALVGDRTDNWQHVVTTSGGGWVLRSYIQPVQCPPPRVTQDVPRTP
jgi:uncharacterized protein YgiM (DUF1202 family)